MRRSIVGDSLNYLGLIVILGIFDAEAYPLSKNRIVQMTDGETRVFMMPFSKATSDGAPERSMWQLTFPASEEDAKALSAGALGTLRGEALRRCGNWHEPIPSIFSSTKDEFVTGYPVYDHDPLSSRL